MRGRAAFPGRARRYPLHLDLARATARGTFTCSEARAARGTTTDSTSDPRA